MALTTYVKGRAYDWSHAIGRAAANGTGFNYPQTMCLGNDGDIFVANRGNENTFAMRVNRVKIGGPGEEELLAEFCTYGETDGHSIWPFGRLISATLSERLQQLSLPMRPLDVSFGMDSRVVHVRDAGGAVIRS